MKKIITAFVAVFCILGLADAQDLEEATKLLNSAEEAVVWDKEEAVELYELALDIAVKLGNEGDKIVTKCKRMIPKLYYDIGKEYADEGHTEDAIENLKKAIETGTANGEEDIVKQAKEWVNKTMLSEAKQAFSNKDYEKAIDGYQRLIEADPSNGKAYFNLGSALATTGNLEDAAKAFKMAFQNGEETMVTGSISYFYLHPAVEFYNNKKWQETLDIALKAPKCVDKQRPEIMQILHKIIGFSAFNLEQYKVAADAFEYYLYLKPEAIKKEASIVYVLGISLQSIGDNNKACDYFQMISQDAQYGEKALARISKIKNGQ